MRYHADFHDSSESLQNSPKAMKKGKAL